MSRCYERISRLYQHVSRWTATVLRLGIDLIYPRCCPLCSRSVPCSAAPTACDICPDCRQVLLLQPPARCTRCSYPLGQFTHSDLTRGCIHCDGRFAFDSLVCLGVYQGALRDACLLAKIGQNEHLSAALAELLVESQGDRLADLQADWIVSVPCHWSQTWRRETHPTPIVAAVLSQRLGIPVNRKCLRKVRRTRLQKRLTLLERKHNLKGAFQLSRKHAKPLADSSVILVDDVLTTGTTANAAVHALRSAGVRHLTVAVLAQGVSRR